MKKRKAIPKLREDTKEMHRKSSVFEAPWIMVMHEGQLLLLPSLVVCKKTDMADFPNGHICWLPMQGA